MARDNRRENIENPIVRRSRKKELENNCKMREAYMELRNSGMSNPEIAEKFGIDISSLYKALQKIADENGVTRESLLDRKVPATKAKPESKSASKAKPESKSRPASKAKLVEKKTKKNFESERVREMKKRFMELHNNGARIPEIAEMFQLSAWSIYHHLQAIADANGVTRDSLLQVVMPKGIKKNKPKSSDCEEKQDVNELVSELKGGFDKAHEILDGLIEVVDSLIKKG